MSELKPVIVYIDDEPRNLTVFEASVPEEWNVICFDSAVQALQKIKEINPWIIISDQKMPQMTGLEFLEVASQLLPEAIRIVVTGQTEEQTIIQLVRRAKIFDYLTKPWDTETLISQLKKAIEFHILSNERKRALEELKLKAAELEKANAREIELRTEIGAWAPAPIVWAIKEKVLELPARRDIVGITYDIIGSSALHGIMVQDKTVTSHVQRLFIERLVKMGGLKESSSGDSTYGHFGAVPFPNNPHVAAMSVAQEFRVALRSFSKMHQIKIECGIALHDAPGTLIQYDEIRVETAGGPVVQKTFDTSSTGVDLLHRIEKLAHELPGSNVLMSGPFIKKLPEPPEKVVRLGAAQLRGQAEPIELYALLSDQVTPEILAKFKEKHLVPAETPVAEIKKTEEDKAA